MSKKILIGIIVAVIVIVLGASGVYLLTSQKSNNNNNANINQTLNEKETQDLKQEVSNNTDKKVLVAYFSYSGTTKGVAEEIANYINADLFEIERKEELNDLYEDSKVEMETDARPEIKANVENIADYDVIFVGYPIWWHSTPRVINTFLEMNNLTNKVVIPFCTAGSSPISETMDSFKASASGATVLDGQKITSTNEVKSFVDSLEIFE